MVKNDNSFFRVAHPTTRIVERNRELLFGLGSPFGYWSITNKYVSQFRRALGTEKFRQFVVQSNDSATYVEALLCTKYLLPTASVPTIPYGYRKILTKGNNGNNYEVYQNEYFLPLGTTYNTYVTEKDFYALSYEQRQQAMLQSLVVDDKKAVRKLKLKKGHSSQSAAVVAYTVETDNHIIWDEENKTITAKRPGTIVLSFQNLPNSEIHLNLENFQFIRHFSNTEVLELTNPAPTQAERANAKQADKKLERLDEVQYTVTIGEVFKTERQTMPYANEYTGNHDHVTNLGVFEDSTVRTVTLTFNAPGVYTYDRLDVVCQPLDTYAAEIAARTEDALENVMMDTNSITGTISLDQKKALYLSIPYSEGWSAKVDGKKAELFHANIMGMALGLEKGDHTIELCYRSPWLKEGVIISGATLLLILFYFAGKIRKRMHHHP